MPQRKWAGVTREMFTPRRRFGSWTCSRKHVNIGGAKLVSRLTSGVIKRQSQEKQNKVLTLPCDQILKSVPIPFTVVFVSVLMYSFHKMQKGTRWHPIINGTQFFPKLISIMIRSHAIVPRAVYSFHIHFKISLYSLFQCYFSIPLPPCVCLHDSLRHCYSLNMT